MNLVLNLTEHCNLRCSYCYYKENPAHAAMSPQTLEQSLSFAWHRVLELGQRQLNVTFFGGEPLLQKDLLRQGVALARELQPRGTSLRFAVNTNGTLLDDSLLELFAQEKFRIFLSLDGPASVHNAQRPAADGTGSWERIAPWIPRLVRMDCVVIRVVTRQHLAGLADSVAWIRNQGFAKIVTAPDFDGGWTAPDLQSLATEYRALARYWQERRAAQDLFYLGTLQDKMRLQLEGSSYKKATCNIMQGAVAVSVRGDLFPCTRFVTGDPASAYKLGHVLTGIDPERAAPINDYLARDKECCGDCSLKDRCQAHGCACVSYYTTGGLSGVSPEVCAHERMLAEICDATALQLMEA